MNLLGLSFEWPRPISPRCSCGSDVFNENFIHSCIFLDYINYQHVISKDDRSRGCQLQIIKQRITISIGINSTFSQYIPKY
ncbi:unnamed protein product [Pieris brassicae]|uniref:Uncharacterized protein n=1 Tax=Pieris brassicae TaxID=7116 RepID=A0A9P0TPM5_PIEBR|nr:unnamed protein product [Pieris brassicae]